MNLDKAEAVKNNTICDLKTNLIKPIKKVYGVEDLTFLER